MPPACVASAAPCAEAPVVLAFVFQNRAWLRPGFPVQSGFAHCRLYVFCQRSIRAWLIFACVFLVYSNSPGISHLSEGSLSIPTAGVVQRNRCSQNLLTTCVLVGRRLHFCNDVSKDISSPADVETCSDAETGDSGADAGVLCVPFPNVGHRNAKQVNVGE